jgi:sortase A
LLLAGLVCVCLYTWYQFEARHFQSKFNASLDRQLPRGWPESETARKESLDKPRLPEEIVGRLDAPRVGLDVIVLRGTDSRTLRRGPGWLTTSAVPGASGNAVIAAHRDTHFRSLRGIHTGDALWLRTANGSFHYTVTWIAVVEPDDVAVLEPTRERALTLVTCFPFSYVGPAPRRFVVRAVAAGPDAPGPA